MYPLAGKIHRWNDWRFVISWYCFTNVVSAVSVSVLSIFLEISINLPLETGTPLKPDLGTYNWFTNLSIPYAHMAGLEKNWIFPLYFFHSDNQVESTSLGAEATPSENEAVNRAEEEIVLGTTARKIYRNMQLASRGLIFFFEK